MSCSCITAHCLPFQHILVTCMYTDTHTPSWNQKGERVRLSLESFQDGGNLEWSIQANLAETDLLRLGGKLRFPILIRALVGIAHKWEAFPQRIGIDRSKMILGYLR
jgi:hypothetical protein